MAADSKSASSLRSLLQLLLDFVFNNVKTTSVVVASSFIMHGVLTNKMISGGSASGNFLLDSSSRILNLVTPLDREVSPQYDLVVTVSLH